MKRRLPWLVLLTILAGWLVAHHASGPGLLQDTDTKVLLEAVRERQAPLSWFGGDWPLKNHFYRPVSTLAFEFDNAVHGNDGAGYGLTNAVICAVCIFLVFWMVWELTESDWTAGVTASLFGLWHVASDATGIVPSFMWVMACVVWLGLFRSGFRRWKLVLAVSAATVCGATWFFVPGGLDVVARTVGWLPGRTATVMTVFTLVAIAAYARFERTSSPPPAPGEATALDLPATKGSGVWVKGKHPWVWVAVAFVGAALALGSYEQAVMLPAVVTGTALLFVLRGRKVHWTVVAGAWGLLAAYLVFRHQVVPSTVSGYQAQQFRNGPAVWTSITDFVLPMFGTGRVFLQTADTGPLIFLTAQPWTYLLIVGGNVAAFWVVWNDRERWTIWFAQVAAMVSYLPMAWLKHFGHYFYWPMAFWALFIVLFVQALARKWVSAVAPPEVQAPPRLGRAEHSPLHP